MCSSYQVCTPAYGICTSKMHQLRTSGDNPRNKTKQGLTLFSWLAGWLLATPPSRDAAPVAGSHGHGLGQPGRVGNRELFVTPSIGR